MDSPPRPIHPFALASHGGLASRPLPPWVASLPVCALATASQVVRFCNAVQYAEGCRYVWVEMPAVAQG